MSEDEFTQLREDVAYIRAKIEIIPDHEKRLRRLEKFFWSLPTTVVASLGAFFGIHHS